MKEEVFLTKTLLSEQLLRLNLLNSFFCFENILEDFLMSGGRVRVWGMVDPW